MAYVINDSCVACGTCIDVSLKAISTLSTLKLAQSVVLVLMFVRLKQFTRQNNNNTQKKRKARFQL